MNSFQKLFCNSAIFYRAALMLLGFSVPISTALDNLLLLLLLIFGLAVFGKDTLKIAYRNPVAQAATLLFGILLCATLYGSTPFGEAIDTLGKYVDLAMIPLFIAVMQGDKNRDSALNGFLFAMLVTLLLSYLVGFGVLKVQTWMWLLCSADDPAIFRHYLVQNTFMALAIFLALLRMRESTGFFARAFFGVFALLGIINVLFMVQGRSGYVTLIILLGWFSWTTFSRYLKARAMHMGLRHGIAVILLMALATSGVYFSSPKLQARMDLIVAELRTWEPHAGNDTSVGIRLEFYYNTLQIIRQNPLVGVGTGGLTAAYAEQDKQFNFWKVRNPHNEYLMITAQTGIIGLALLLYLFYTQWRNAPLLDSVFNQDAARGLVLATMADCSFNSPLLDHAPGLLFALMSATFFSHLRLDIKRG